MGMLRSIERVTDAAAIFGVLIMIPLMLAMVYEVVSRYLFNAPTIWAFEVSYMMMAAIFASGFAYALKERQHVNVDFIYGSMPPRVRAAVDIAGYILFFPSVVWLAKALFDYALRAFHSGEVSGLSAWNPVVWPVRAVLFLGFAVFALQIAVEIVRAVRTLFTGEEQVRAT